MTHFEIFYGEWIAMITIYFFLRLMNESINPINQRRLLNIVCIIPSLLFQSYFHVTDGDRMTYRRSHRRWVLNSNLPDHTTFLLASVLLHFFNYHTLKKCIISNFTQILNNGTLGTSATPTKHSSKQGHLLWMGGWGLPFVLDQTRWFPMPVDNSSAITAALKYCMRLWTRYARQRHKYEISYNKGALCQ